MEISGPATIIFLSDGCPTVRPMEEAKLLERAKLWNTEKKRLETYGFGVGGVKPAARNAIVADYKELVDEKVRERGYLKYEDRGPIHLEIAKRMRSSQHSHCDAVGDFSSDLCDAVVLEWFLTSLATAEAGFHDLNKMLADKHGLAKY